MTNNTYSAKQTEDFLRKRQVECRGKFLDMFLKMCTQAHFVGYDTEQIIMHRSVHARGRWYNMVRIPENDPCHGMLTREHLIEVSDSVSAFGYSTHVTETSEKIIIDADLHVPEDPHSGHSGPVFVGGLLLGASGMAIAYGFWNQQ